jgi:chlorite dismutase
MTTPLNVVFRGASTGPWAITAATTVVGEGLPAATHLAVSEGWDAPTSTDAAWSLRGVVSYDRYLRTDEKASLGAVQEGLGRPSSTLAAFIPIRKKAEWWALPHQERRAILEESSRHIRIGLEYLPAVARRLHHSRELGEPFDFLTWFEFGPADVAAFDELVGRLRASEEWAYVDREVDLRLSATPTA